MDYLSILSQIDKDFIGLSNTDLIKQFNEPSNNIVLINDIKNFIFDNGLNLDVNVIGSYLASFIDEDDIVEFDLVYEYFKIFDKGNRICQDMRNIKYKDLNITLNDTDWPYSDTIIPFLGNDIPIYIRHLQTLIYLALKKTKIIDIDKIKNIDISMIKDSYNNFYIKKFDNIVYEHEKQYILNNRTTQSIKSLIHSINTNKDISIFREKKYQTYISYNKIWTPCMELYKINGKPVFNKNMYNRNHTIENRVNVSNTFLNDTTVTNVIVDNITGERTVIGRTYGNPASVNHIITNNENENNTNTGEYPDSLEIPEDFINNPYNGYFQNSFNPDIKYNANGLSGGSFMCSYPGKQIENFKVDYQHITNINNKLDIDNTILFFNLCQKYSDITKKMQEKEQAYQDPSYNPEHITYRISNKTITRFWFDCYDKEKTHNYLIAYYNIHNFVNEHFNQKMFINMEYDEAIKTVKKIINEEKNTSFIVFDLAKAFYKTRITKIIEYIKLRFPLKKHRELYTYLNILFEFLRSIKKNFFTWEDNKYQTNDYLPITPFSQLIFKFFILCLFEDEEICETYVSYADDFIVFGNHDNILNRFSKLYNNIKDDYTLSTFKIYDKLFHNKIRLCQTTLPLNIDLNKQIELFKTNNTNTDNITIRINLEMSFEETISRESVIRTVVDIVKPEELLSLFNMIPNDKNKKFIGPSQKELEEKLCKICFINEHSHVLDNCGHIFCIECLKKLNKDQCPCCKTKFNKFIKLYNI
ncbi:putative inhibitor of apoptosis protein [Yalta virus]|nr:putative inhibitor of apoptosis protein [Yalta virus]